MKRSKKIKKPENPSIQEVADSRHDAMLWGIVTISSASIWLITAGFKVGQAVPELISGERFNWTFPLLVAAAVVPGALFAFQWGRAWQRVQQHKDKAHWIDTGE